MTLPSAARPRIQAVDLASADDPYPQYERLRQQGAVVRGEFGQSLVTRHATVSALLRDARLASHFPPDFIRLTLGSGPAAQFPERIVLTNDPPLHTQVRRFFGAAFGTAAVRAMAPNVSELVDTLLRPALDTGRIELVGDVAVPLPVTVICRLIGIPDADKDEVLPRVIELAKVFDAANLTVDERGLVDEAVTWLRDYVSALLTTAHPDQTSLAARYAHQPPSDRLDLPVVVDNLLFLFHAGFETTMGLLSNGCAALLAHPDQLARLRATPALVSSAIDEFLRYDSPIQNAIRVARETIELEGTKIRAGRSVMLLLGAANRDPGAFDDPTRLDIGRSPNPHLGFGGGLHHCLGTALARLMGELVFAALTTRFRDLALAGPAHRRRHGSLRSFERLPLALRPA